MVGNDLTKLLLDVGRVSGLTTNAGERASGVIHAVLLDKVTGGLWEEEETDGENDGPEHLNGNGDTVGASVQAVLGGVGHARSEEKTDGDAELVTRDCGGLASVGKRHCDLPMAPRILRGAISDM